MYFYYSLYMNPFYYLKGIWFLCATDFILILSKICNVTLCP